MDPREQGNLTFIDLPEKHHGDVLQHMDWTRAMGNHQRVHLEYPEDLREKPMRWRLALEAKDSERPKAAQHGLQLRWCHALSDLMEAIDLDFEESQIADKTAKEVKEADEELEQKLVRGVFSPGPKERRCAQEPSSSRACCILM